MNIAYAKLHTSELGSAFELFKTYMKPVIDGALGWDEAFQRNGFLSHFQHEWFSWIVCSGEKVGLVCRRQKENSLHIHLLVVFSHEQRRGIATSVISTLQIDADAKQVGLTLSCFKNNTPALSLYKKLDFIIQSEDEHFYNLVSTA